MRTMLLFGVLMVVVACKTVPNVSPPPIPVPEGLSESDVELAILLAVADPPQPPELSPGQQITDSVLASILGSYESVANPRQPWYFEGREPGAIIAGFQEGAYYMRVVIAFNTRDVTLSITDSRNLEQSGSRIHKGVYPRLQTLENRIRRTLGQISRRNIYGGTDD